MVRGLPCSGPVTLTDRVRLTAALATTLMAPACATRLPVEKALPATPAAAPAAASNGGSNGASPGASASALVANEATPVQRLIRARGAQLRSCYQERGLKQDPTLAGTITVALDVDSTGSAANARVTRQEWVAREGQRLGEEDPVVGSVHECVLERVNGWRFPAFVAPGSHEFELRFSRR